MYGNNTWHFLQNDNDFYNPVYVDEDNILYIEKSTIARNTQVIQGESRKQEHILIQLTIYSLRKDIRHIPLGKALEPD